MAPLLLGNIASSIFSALNGSSDSQDSTPSQDPFDNLVSQLEQTGGETTTTKADGSTVTTLPTANGSQRIVSETSAAGQTLTEAGYTSPIQAQKFLDNLFATLKSDGASVTSAGATSVTGAVNKLNTQIAAAAPRVETLVNSFGSLLQSSGISLPSGGTASSALKSFLANATPAIESGKLASSGVSVRA